nr:gamma-heregulin [Homo sapiens]
MDVKERKPYRSLTRRRDAERRYTSSSADSEEGKAPQKSYSSSETLKAYDQDARLAYGSRVKDIVPQEAEEFCRTGANFTLRELGLEEVTPPHGTLYRTDIGLPHCGYSMGAGSDADMEADTVLSPEHPVRLWGRSTRSGRSSCLSSRANSNLTLTDTEHENTETDHPGGLQNHARLRTPPPPLSHAHTPNQHHAASINSLNRGNFTPRSNPSPAPTDHSLSGEPPAGGAQEPAHAQENWLLNSNIPLETRNLGKQPFLGTLQDNLIEMDILGASRHDGAYSDGHFLFKPGGTSPLFCTTSPGYPLTSSTVYSPPPRPLPRSTFARPAFNLKKPSKYCNWKCAALSAIVISATLVILLAYFVAMHLFGLNWHLQPMEGQMYEITEDTASSWPVPTDVSLYPSGGTGLETPDRKGKGTTEGKPSSFFPEDSFIDSGEIDVGRRASQKIPPGTFWRSQVFIDHPVHLKFNVSLGKAALVGIYGRKGLPPSHTQFDFVELLDGRRLLTQEARSLEGTPRQSRGTVPPSSHETGFIQYLDSGIWHLAFYNDGKESEVVSFLTTAIALPPRLKEMKSQESAAGSKLVLRCETSSEYSSLRFKWFKNGNELNRKNKPQNIKIQKKPGKSELRINKASLADSGEYMCKVISKLGNDSASANITIVESNEIITGMPASTEGAYVSSESPIRISVSTEGANTSSSTSTSTTGTSHLVKCAEKEKTFCVNGGECFMVKDLSNPSRYLCKCPNEFTGDRCQNYVMASFYSTSTPFLSLPE